MAAASQRDYSDDFSPLRSRLLAETGGAYLPYLKGLAPRYSRVWRDIALGYVSLAVIIHLIGLPDSLALQILAVLPAAVALGYGLAFLQLFLHEAAHFNLTRNPRLNDLLCDALISWQVGTTIRRYRPIHFAHHREIGTTQDTERSYFNALTLRFLLETLTGIHAVRVLRSRERGSAKARTTEIAPVLRGMLIHLTITVGAYLHAGWPAAAAWILGTAAFYPFFATLRQLAEHRSSAAEPGCDFTQTDHGAVTRLFGSGPVAATFGGAGFNRHLLHHWEPRVSYTRLPDLERYVASTSARELIAARQTTYARALADIWRNDHRA